MATDAYIMEWTEGQMPHHTTKKAAEQRMAGILNFDDSFSPSPKDQKASPALAYASPVKNTTLFPVKSRQIRMLQRPFTIQTKQGGRW